MLLVIVTLSVVGTATLRNWIVSKTFVPSATSFGVNLHLGNEPPRPLDPAPPHRLAAYQGLGIGDYVRGVLEYAIQAPSAFADGLQKKALYSLGFFGRSGLPGGRGTSWLCVTIWSLGIAGMVRMLGRAAPGRNPLAWLAAAAALTHFAAVVPIFPHGYGDRLVLPLYPPLIPYAAFAAELLLRAGLRMPSLAFWYAAALSTLTFRVASVQARRLRELAATAAAVSIRLVSRMDWRRYLGPRTGPYIGYAVAAGASGCCHSSYSSLPG